MPGLEGRQIRAQRRPASDRRRRARHDAAYLTGATDEKKLPAGAPSDEEDPLDTRLRELLSHADDDLKQAMIAFLERFQKK